MSLILLLDSNGHPNSWVTWKTAACYYSKGLVSWNAGECELVLRGGNNKFTGEQSIIKASSIIAVKGQVSSKWYRPPSLTNPELFRRDRYTCAYCGQLFKHLQLSRDHIIPKSKGGPDTWMNVVTCCERCNQKKEAKSLEECGMTLLYVPYVPNRAEHLLLQNRHILYDQMQFLLAFAPKKSRIHEYAADLQSLKYPSEIMIEEEYTHE